MRSRSRPPGGSRARLPRFYPPAPPPENAARRVRIAPPRGCDSRSSMDIADLRKDYARASLYARAGNRHPIAHVARWVDEALKSQLREPTAMALATVGAGGRPSARMVLLKGFDARGFVFYTNYDSRKGRELAANPQASLLFFWAELERQVRIEGIIEQA